MSEKRCERWDLPVSQCAHCRGDAVPGLVPDWTTTNPTPPPPAVPAREVQVPRPRLGCAEVRVLAELDDVYLRLFEHLPALSTGRNTDNAAAYAAAPDPRRAPVRIEVLDLISQIEAEVPDLARSVCDSMGVMRCVAFPCDSASGSPEISPRVVAALATLNHHWRGFAEVMPEMAEEVEGWLTRLVAVGRRLLGETSAPVPLSSPCPECGQPTVFRLETERGSIAVCGNPADRDEYGAKRQWTETEWEDAHPRYVHQR